MTVSGLAEKVSVGDGGVYSTPTVQLVGRLSDSPRNAAVTVVSIEPVSGMAYPTPMVPIPEVFVDERTAPSGIAVVGTGDIIGESPVPDEAVGDVIPVAVG